MRLPLLLAALLAACASAAPAPLPQRSAKIKSANGPYKLEGYSFAKRSYWDFSKLANGAALPAGLHASDYTVDNSYVFVPSNVYISGGYLTMKVPGGQKAKPYRAGEVTTTLSNIRAASVRTVAILTENPGVCNGMFFYHDDTQETDIEWLSDQNSESNAGTRKVWFATQATSGNQKKAFKAVAPPSKATSTEHEYRLDWFPGLARFYIDGVKVWETTKTVPTVPGAWVFNNWADGDKGWSVGPPAKDAIFKIKEIDMYYNTS